jgi:hypothetical protein
MLKTVKKDFAIHVREFLNVTLSFELRDFGYNVFPYVYCLFRHCAIRVFEVDSRSNVQHPLYPVDKNGTTHKGVLFGVPDLRRVSKKSTRLIPFQTSKPDRARSINLLACHTSTCKRHRLFERVGVSG